MGAPTKQTSSQFLFWPTVGNYLAYGTALAIYGGVCWVIVRVWL